MGSETGTEHRSRWLAGLARFALIAYCYIVMSGLVTFFFYMKTPLIDTNERATTISMIDGTAYRPFVYRRLLPSVAEAIVSVVPESIDSSLAAKASSPSARSLITFLQWDQDRLLDHMVVAALIYACFLGFMVSLRWIAKLAYPDNRLVYDFAPIAAMLLLPPLFAYAKYIYDAPTLLLFALGFAAILARRNVLYYPVFVLAAINKETAILLVPLFIMSLWGKKSKIALSIHTLVQVALWAAIVLWLRHVFVSNPGFSVEYHLMDHNLVPVYLQQKLLAAAYVAILAVVVRFGWSASPYGRRALLAVVVPLVTLTLLCGWIEELRDYLEAMPMVFALLIPGVRNLYGLSVRNDQGHSSEVAA